MTLESILECLCLPNTAMCMPRCYRGQSSSIWYGPEYLKIEAMDNGCFHSQMTLKNQIVGIHLFEYPYQNRLYPEKAIRSYRADILDLLRFFMLSSSYIFNFFDHFSKNLRWRIFYRPRNLDLARSIPI